MARRPVHLAVYDTHADRETGHATAHLALAGYEVRTAAPTGAPVAFAREVLRLPGAYDEPAIGVWHRLFHDSDPRAYAELEEAQVR